MFDYEFCECSGKHRFRCDLPVPRQVFYQDHCIRQPRSDHYPSHACCSGAISHGHQLEHQHQHQQQHQHSHNTKQICTSSPPIGNNQDTCNHQTCDRLERVLRQLNAMAQDKNHISDRQDPALIKDIVVQMLQEVNAANKTRACASGRCQRTEAQRDQLVNTLISLSTEPSMPGRSNNSPTGDRHHQLQLLDRLLRELEADGQGLDPRLRQTDSDYAVRGTHVCYPPCRGGISAGAAHDLVARAHVGESGPGPFAHAGWSHGHNVTTAYMPPAYQPRRQKRLRDLAGIYSVWC